jgi:hypothetical protein
MLTLVRIAQTMPGKIGDAIAFGKEVAPMIKRVTGAELALQL